MIRFTDWLKKMDEVGTGTGDVAVFQRPILSGPLKTRLWPWGEKDKFFSKKKHESFADYMKKMDEYAPMMTQAVSSATQTLPQGNQPSMIAPINPAAINPAAINPSQYRGTQKAIYGRLFGSYMKNKNLDIGKSLMSAVQGNDNDLLNADKTYK